MLAQKSATQHGDGEGTLAFWKNSLADYHDEKKVFAGFILRCFIIIMISAEVSDLCAPQDCSFCWVLWTQDTDRCST